MALSPNGYGYFGDILAHFIDKYFGVIKSDTIFVYMKKASNPKKGRKPIPDKKERVLLFVEKSKIEKLGGVDETKGAAYEGIDNKLKEKENE